MNTSLFNDLGSTDTVRHLFRKALFLVLGVLLLTRVCLAQNSETSKIPDGEAQFTREQLEEYYLVYKNPEVRHLRTLFDSYLHGRGVSEQERQILDKWDKAYFRSKFIVMSLDDNIFGGTFITILFQDRPDKVLVAWVYPEGSNKQLVLRGLKQGDYSEEDIRRIKIRYKKLIEDKVHAM
jgi:hypothetical protein